MFSKKTFLCLTHQYQNMQEDNHIIVQRLREGFHKGVNLNYKQRIHHLNLLKNIVKDNEQLIFEAIRKDFHKPDFETFLTELLPLYMEISHFKKKLKRYMRPARISTPLPLLPASGRIYQEPKGVVLIIGAWNYPVNLLLIPLVSALAAGNTVLLKPSENTPYTSPILKKILTDLFPKNVLNVVEGDGPFTSELLNEKFNHIFYTGSTQVGHIIYEKAAQHLCPVTLELGGKSPAIFCRAANMKTAVKRLLWGKMINSGQTCVAPDYALIPLALKEEFIRLVAATMQEIGVPKENATYIINDRHFQRLKKLLDGNHKIIYGGNYDEQTRWIELTITEIESIDSPLMKEEIFGPVLPVFFYDDEKDIQTFYNAHPDPLALYIFSTNKEFSERIIRQYPSGGVLINDTLLHLGHENLPFGGRGTSGFGNYHGKAGFHCFSHSKSVMKQATRFDLNYRYYPYTERKFNFLKTIARFFQ